MAKARRVLAAEAAEVEIRNAIAFEALGGIDDPVAVLSELATTALATERALAARVNDLAQDAQLRYRDDRGVEQLRAEVSLWERWHRQAARLAEKLAGLDLESRQVRLAEQQGALMDVLLRGVLARMLGGVLDSLQDAGAAPDLLRLVEDHWDASLSGVVVEEIRKAMANPVVPVRVLGA